MTVVVVTDSAASLDSATARKFGIAVVPVHVLVNGIEVGADADADIDYASATVTTSAPSPGELRTAYAAALTSSDGDGVVAVHISRRLSATWESARQAADELGEQVRVVDSLAAGMGTGFAAIAAARQAARGSSLARVAAEAERVAAQARAFIVVDRVEQLRRGGRISTAAAFFGTALVTKPVLCLADGRIELLEKARTASKAFAKLVAAAVDAAGVDGAAVAVQHLGAPQPAARLATQLRAQVPDIHEVIEAEFGPVLGVHLGLGAVGVVVVPGGAGLHGE